MEHPMRRKNQRLTYDQALEILQRNTHGVLACVDEDGEPYAVPLSYVVVASGPEDNSRISILFHCAKEGHKLRCIEHEPRVSFAVVDQDLVVPERFTTYFRSVIAFGRARKLSAGELSEALEILAAKYAPNIDVTQEIADGLSRVAVVEIAVERLSGKQAKELSSRS